MCACAPVAGCPAPLPSSCSVHLQLGHCAIYGQSVPRWGPLWLLLGSWCKCEWKTQLLSSWLQEKYTQRHTVLDATRLVRPWPQTTPRRGVTADKCQRGQDEVPQAPAPLEESRQKASSCAHDFPFRNHSVKRWAMHSFFSCFFAGPEPGTNCTRCTLHQDSAQAPPPTEPF